MLSATYIRTRLTKIHTAKLSVKCMAVSLESRVSDADI